MKCAFETFEPEQLLFGTDYPHVPGGLQVFVDTFDAAAAAVGYTGAQRELVAGGNARRLLRI
jgi:aminocarboxymuconate-semialdehyde decarboxylase